MARSAVLSNGKLLVAFDEYGLVRDFYYPYVGQANLTNEKQVEHKIGVWVDGRLSWLNNGDWQLQIDFATNGLSALGIYTNQKLKIRLKVHSFIDHKEDIFGRRLELINLGTDSRDIKVFMHQVFLISRNGRSDTAMYVPSTKPHILMYRGNNSFVIGARDQEGWSFDQFAVGLYAIEGKAGTFEDALDGNLSNNPIEHGSVDSTLRLSAKVSPSETWTFDYWVVASSVNYHDATSLHRELAAGGLSKLITDNQSYWTSWLAKAKTITQKLDPETEKNVIRSLLIVKAHIDIGGGIIASCDSSLLNYGRDYYSYVWPRDAYYALLPFVKLGYDDEALRFLNFLQKSMHPRGYLHHKYQPDGSIGSTWHPLVQNGRPELNIQEDESASAVLLYEQLYYSSEKTLELEKLFESLIKPLIDFMSRFIDHSTGLPHASYDLWEEKFLTTTYTTALVLKALEFGVKIAEDKQLHTELERWQKALISIKKNFHKLFSVDDQYFVKGLLAGDRGSFILDKTIDSSTFYALYKYAPISLDNAALKATADITLSRLFNISASGGMIRYPKDSYMLNKNYDGNPWIVCTLWLAQYYLRINETNKAKELLEWVSSKASTTGVFSEQIDPVTSSDISVAPLVWSHAEYIITALEYLEKIS